MTISTFSKPQHHLEAAIPTNKINSSSKLVVKFLKNTNSMHKMTLHHHLKDSNHLTIAALFKCSSRLKVTQWLTTISMMVGLACLCTVRIRIMRTTLGQVVASSQCNMVLKLSSMTIWMMKREEELYKQRMISMIDRETCSLSRKKKLKPDRTDAIKAKKPFSSGPMRERSRSTRET